MEKLFTYGTLTNPEFTDNSTMNEFYRIFSQTLESITPLGLFYISNLLAAAYFIPKPCFVLISIANCRKTPEFIMNTAEKFTCDFLAEKGLIICEKTKIILFSEKAIDTLPQNATQIPAKFEEPYQNRIHTQIPIIAREIHTIYPY